ncbi:MAG: bifunctional 2-C-methyl-D-erythritol 4-phosphate cytidylyltransferase/2-C-methyl-D-erythritol 2,4-cyclodiphosphate synthase [Acuticoccus sp.]
MLAAGRGTRFGSQLPKQFLTLGGRTVVARSIDAFLNHPAIRRVCVAIGAEDEARFAASVGDRSDRVLTVVGGDTRQASVLASLDGLGRDSPPDRVLVHDGARPFVSDALIQRVIDALDTAAAVIPAIPVADTIKRVENGAITATVPRQGLQLAQTPQGFHYAALCAAHRAAQSVVTDDAGVMEAAGHPVTVVAGERANNKLTTSDDLDDALRGLGGISVVGQGFDVHAIAPGGPLILGGLTFDVDFHLAGHSDADVALHALTDALFGAIADGDIGAHFPPSDPRWRGAASDLFLRHAAERVRAVGTIAHLDLTIICERPKVGPVRDEMREVIAEICAVSPRMVSVKATTSERLGFTGRGEGIAAQAVATVVRY